MDVRLSDSHYYFVYDPILYGYSTQFWKDISGAATISSNKVRVNATTIASKEQYQRGDFTFRLTAPTAPTTGDDRKVGLVSPAQGLTKNALFFKWDGEDFTAEVVNSAGTATSTVITWLAAWTNTVTNYEIIWLQRSVAFYIGGIKVAEVTDQDLLPARSALSAYVLNANADNFDLTYLQVAAAEKYVPSKEVAVTLSASDIEIGAVEIKDGSADTRQSVTTRGSKGAAAVEILDGSGNQITSFGLSVTDDAAYTVGSGSLTPVGGTYKSTRDAVDDNDAGVFAMTAKRAQYVSLETPLADSAMDDTYDAVKIIPSAYATDDSAMPATPVTMPVSAEFRNGATTYTDGDATVLQSDVNGNLKVTLATLGGGEDLTNNVLGVVTKPIAASTYSLSRSAIFGTDVDVSAKAAAGNVYSIHASNSNAAVRYFQIHNKASAPANPDVPVFSFPIPPGGVIDYGVDFFGSGGYHLSTGVAYGVSTTNATFTAATTTDHNEHVMYI